MKNENSEVQPKGKRRTFKIITWVLIGTAGVVLLLFFGIPLYLSSAGGTNLLLGKINESVDGQVEMEDFSIGWFKGVHLTNVSYADTDGTTSIKVDRIETQPQYTSFLGGKVKLGKTVVEKPQIYMKVSQAAAEERKREKDRQKDEKPSGTFPVDQMNLQVIDGSATIEMLNGTQQTVQFANIASTVQIAEAGKPSSVVFSMDVDENSKVSANGTVTPEKDGWTLKEGDFEVHISTLELASLQPLFALAGQAMDMTGQLNADATIQVKEGVLQRLQADAKITGFAQGSGDQRTAFEKPVTLSALLVGSGETVTIENATVQSSFCTINCAGTLESLDYDISADLAQTQQFAGQFTDMQGMAVKGQLAAKGKVAMADERIAVTGTGSARQLVIRKEEVQTPVTDVQLDFDCALDQAANQFKLASANLTAAPGTVNVSNMALPLSSEAQKAISFDARAKMDLAKTWPFVQVFTELPKDMQIAGMLDSVITATTSGSSVRMRTEKTQIDNLRILKEGSEPFERERVSLVGDVIWQSEETLESIEIPSMNMLDENGEALLKINNARIERQKSQSDTKVRGDLKAEYDLKTLSAMASPFLPEGLMLEGKRTDSVRFESQYPTDQPELLNANLNADATFGFAKAQFNGLDIGSTEMKLNVVKGLMDVTIPKTTVNTGTLQLAGTMDLKENPRFFRLKEPMAILQDVKVNDVLTHSLLKFTNPIFADAASTDGIVNFSCQRLELPIGKEHLNQMLIRGTFGIQSLKLQAGDLLGQILTLAKTRDTAVLTLHPTDFTVRNGFLSYQDMQLDIGSTPLHFSGRIGLDQSLAMTVQVPISGRNIPLPLAGTLTKPQLDTGKLGQELIRQELQRQLEGLF